MTEHIALPGATIAFTDSGRGAPAFVFLHYWGGAGRSWRRVIAALGEGYRSLAPDLRGWGASAVTDGRYDLEAMADDVAGLLLARGLGRVVLVGHSMGGKIAQMLAMRGLPGLAGLVLVAPAPFSPMPVPAEMRAAMRASYDSAAGIDQALGVLAGPGLDAEARATVLEDTQRGAPGAKDAWTAAGMIADLGPGLGRFTGPAAILVGDADRVEDAGRLRALYAEALPQADFRLLPGIGHLAPFEAPDAIAAACRSVATACAA